jgi:thiol-disulfide isomerase/thioredoxin
MNTKLKFNLVSSNVGRNVPMILVLLAMTLFSSTVFAQSPNTETKTEANPEVKIESPKIIAVELYADWCAACKELMPKMAEIKKTYQNKQILVVRFDMTDEATKAQAGFMASYSGLAEVYKKGGGKTGLVALVNPKTKEIYGVITIKKTADEISKMIDDAIAKAEVAK